MSTIITVFLLTFHSLVQLMTSKPLWLPINCKDSPCSKWLKLPGGNQQRTF